MDEQGALSALHDILARSVFQTPPDRIWQAWLAAAIGRVLNQVSRAFDAVESAASGHEGTIGYLLIALVGGALLVAATLVVRLLRQVLVGEARQKQQAAEERRRRADDLWRDAERLAASGEFSRAARALYLSSLYALDERALLHVRAGLTNREHVTRLRRDAPVLGNLFGDLVERYDRARYGGTPLNAQGYEELKTLAVHARAAT